MGICSWLVFGFLAGLVARALMPGDQPMGFIKTSLLGIAGSFVGGFVASLLFGGNFMVLRSSGFIGSVIGAILILAISGYSRRR